MTILEEMQAQDFELLNEAGQLIQKGEEYVAAANRAHEEGYEWLRDYYLSRAIGCSNKVIKIHKELREHIKTRENLLKVFGA